jgi:hypothetical protein
MKVSLKPLCVGYSQTGWPGTFGSGSENFNASITGCDAPYLLPLTAARMPCNNAVGVGGQPGTSTSTGMTLEILPQVA